MVVNINWNLNFVFFFIFFENINQLITISFTVKLKCVCHTPTSYDNVLFCN